MIVELISKKEFSYRTGWSFWIPTEGQHYHYYIYYQDNMTQLLKSHPDTLAFAAIIFKGGIIPMDEDNPMKSFKKLEQLAMLQ